jgi:hypothetical protein
MTTCDYCKKKIDGLPHACKYCGKVHCSNHLLPENHNCVGLEEHKKRKIEKWRDTSTFSSMHKYEEPIEEYKPIINKNSKKHHTKKEQKRRVKPSEKIKYFFSDKFYHLKKWLLKRDHWEYNFNKRKKYLSKIIPILSLSILGLFFFYSRADQFNQISLWIFNLGGILILTSLFFAIKYGLDFFKETHNFYKRQKKWIKILIIFILLILIWQGFSNGQILTEKVKTSYSRIEFSLLSPFSLSKSPGYSGQEVSLPSFFSENSCSEIEQHAKNQYLNSAKYKKNFCGAICGQQNLEYQRYSCDKEDKFHCFCKQIENE